MAAARRGTERQRPVIEWVFGAVSGAIVLALLGFFAYEALFASVLPPKLQARVERLERDGATTTVFVAVSNEGDEAAADVGIEAIAATPTDPATRDLRFDYVPAKGLRRGALIFEGRDLQEADVRLVVKGYVEP